MLACGGGEGFLPAAGFLAGGGVGKRAATSPQSPRQRDGAAAPLLGELVGERRDLGA